MELWVRSQNGKRLSKIHNLVIREANQKGFYAIAESNNKNTIEYGTYNKQERASEVLDEIQSFVDRHKDYPANAYQMPKE